jgi:transcriptional regulator with XRE-family HTH domain
MAGDFAAELQRLRLERGLSYRALAAEAFCSSSYVEGLEKHHKTSPKPAVVRALDDALHAEGALVAIAESALEDTNQKINVPRPRPLDGTDAAHARATTKHLVALDILEGTQGLTPVATRAFRRVADALAVAGGTVDARSAAADLGVAAAWIASDDLQRDQSRAIALEALALADMAGDTRLHRFLVSHLSMVSEHGGRFGDALAYAERLEHENVDNPRVAAMIKVRRARALSGLGAAKEAVDAWEHADHLLTASPSSDDGLTYWIHSAEMAVHKAIILTRAGDRSAVEWAQRGIELLPDEQGRDKVLWRGILLHEAVCAQAWAEVPAIVEDLLRYAGDTRSARVREEIGRTRRLVTRGQAPQRVRDAVRAAYEAFKS